jgi:hypothetical protein
MDQMKQLDIVKEFIDELQKEAAADDLLSVEEKELNTPQAKKSMKRAHFFLPPEQLAFLDKMAAKAGEGVSRSDWLRYAISRLMQDAEEGKLYK